MSHPRMREYVYRAASNVVAEFRSSAHEDHPGLKGRIRELALTKLIRPFLPPTIGAITGKVVDSNGNESGELDIILFDRELLPPLLYSEAFGLVPIESCLYVVEVKSLLNADEVRKCVAAATRIRELRSLSGRIVTHSFDHKESAVVPKLIPTNCQSLSNYAVIAFQSDLSYKESQHDDLERFLHVCPNMADSVGITSLCVLNRGYWSHDNSKWYYGSASHEHRELVTMLIGLCNTVPQIRATKSQPDLGVYWSSGDGEFMEPLKYTDET